MGDDGDATRGQRGQAHGSCHDARIDAHPDLAGTGAAMRAEWRDEQEAAGRDAAEAWRHGRTLVDVLRDHMHRGDRLALDVAGRRVAGRVEELGADLLALRTVFGRVDVQLAPTVPLRVEVLERAASGGHRGVDAAGGRFRNALLLREGADEVTLGTVTDPDGLDGRLVVGADHAVVVARAGAETVVPIAQVSWVGPRRQ